jgi:DUF438 domain-containing protein
MKDTQKLAGYLKRISAGEDVKRIRQMEFGFFKRVRPSDLALAEQELLDNGFTVHQLGESQLQYLELVGDQLHKLWSSLPHNHIVRRLLAEHEIYSCMLADLEDVNRAIQQAETISDTSTEFRKFAHIVQHLASTEDHSELEEDIIFPVLKKHQLGHLVRMMKTDHAYIKFAINSIVRLLDDFEELDLLEFKVRLDSSSEFVINAIREHMLVENYIVLPLAIELIRDPQVWEHLKASCDDMGYCGMHGMDL